jgi:hypothetical protein
LLLLVIGVWRVLLLLWFSRVRSAADGSADKRFGVITAERINIVDADGKPRLVISNPARFPDAVVRGKSHKRSIGDTAGMLFYDVDGTETGGLVTATAEWGRYAALIFDYTTPPTAKASNAPSWKRRTATPSWSFPIQKANPVFCLALTARIPLGWKFVTRKAT